MGALLIGTSGYSYDDWVGPVYPEGTKRGDFLPFYAERFSFTELNFTYYREPNPAALRRIGAKVPAEFRFTVKAPGALTHERRRDWPAAAARFVEAADALGDRLAGALLQFPFSFHYETANRRYLASVTDALRPLRLFVEFRNAEWQEPTVLREMERRGLALVIPDLPRLKGLPRVEPRLTAPWGYVRFHGRNAAAWWNGTNVTRYDYRYGEDELAEWVGPIHSLVDRAEAVVIAFNNHFAGQAVENATQLAAMLAGGTATVGS